MWDDLALWFQFPFPWWLVMFIPVGHLYIFLRGMLFQVLCPFLKIGLSDFCYWVAGGSYIFWKLTLYHCIPLAALFFPVACFLCWTEVFKFDLISLVYFVFCCLCFRCHNKEVLPNPMFSSNIHSCIFQVLCLGL